MALGYCIARWSYVEERLFKICKGALKCPPKQAAIVFYRSPTLDVRLSLTEEIVQAAFGKSRRMKARRKAWKEIASEIRRLSPLRNRLAHHTVESDVIPVRYIEGDKVVERTTLTLLRVLPSKTERLRGRAYGKKAVRWSDMMKHLEEVDALISQMNRYLRPKRRAKRLRPSPPNQSH